MTTVPRTRRGASMMDVEVNAIRGEVRRAATAGAVIAVLLYVGCVLWDLVLPRYAMHVVWGALLPGFTWLTWRSFLLGLAESLLYGALLGWLIAWVPRVIAGATLRETVLDE